MKTIKTKDMIGLPVMKEEKLTTIEKGEIFGEDNLCFERNNQYSIRVASNKLVVLAVTYNDLRREYKRLIQPLTEYAEKRGRYLDDRMSEIMKARRYEKKNFASDIEKGKMKVF